MAGTDVTEAAWVPMDRLREYNLWNEAYRVIDIARGLVG
jgi:hypothetical protein